MKLLTQSEIDKLVVAERNSQPRKVYWGIGCLDVDFYIEDRYGSNRWIWQYFLWQVLLKHCCNPYFKQGKNSVTIRNQYTICDEWLSFANFLGWINKEVDYNGNKPDFYLNCQGYRSDCLHYSPETTMLLPKELNEIVYKSHVKYDINLPTGVRKRGWSKGCYHSGYNCWVAVDGKDTFAAFDTPEEAFLAYKVAKEAQIKAVANQYKDVLKPAVYESLMNWEIEP